MSDTQPAIMRPQQVADYLGMTRRHLYNVAERDPEFPRKIVISTRLVGWRREAIDQWLKVKEGAA